MTGMLGCKPAKTPIEPNVKLKPANPECIINKKRYQRLVEKLSYLSHMRLDIAFPVSHCSFVGGN